MSSNAVAGAAVEYTAQVSSPNLTSTARLSIGADALHVVSPFAAIDVPFYSINAITTADFVVRVITDDGPYEFSALGNWCQPFHDALAEAFGQAVLRGMFVRSAPVFIASGDYQVSEPGVSLAGSGTPIRVFDDAVVSLPPNLAARRVPLCFATGFQPVAFGASLRVGPDESYSYSRLGNDTAGFVAAVEGQLRALREATLAQVNAIDPSLAPAAASQIAGLVSAGTAAPMTGLARIAPSFVAALEARLAASVAALPYKAFKAASQNIWVGMRAQGDDYLLWLIVASPNGNSAAVEFAVPDTATFVYRTGGQFAQFARQLNIALEAIDFKREVIWTPDDQLTEPDWKMAIKRNSALRFVRANYVGRAIHTDGWQTAVNKLCEAG